MLLAARLHHQSLLATAALAGLFIIILSLTFISPLSYFIKIMAEPENNYGYLVILIGLFVLWQRSSLLLRLPHSPSWIGTAIIALAVVLMLFGELGFMKRLSYGAFFLFIAGILVSYFGRSSIILLLAPFVAFALAVPVPGYLAIQISTTLQQLSSIMGTEILRFFDVPVLRDGNIIDLGVYQLQVAEACSGLRYLFPLLIMAIVVVWLARAPWWSKGLTLLAVIPLTVTLNSIRIAMTGVLVNFHGIEAAQGFMHFFEGWLVFLIALVVLAALLCATTWLAGGVANPQDILDFERIDGRALAPAATTRKPRLPSPLTGPVLAGIALLAAGTMALQPLEERTERVPERVGFWSFPLAMEGYRGEPRTIDGDTRRALGSSDELLVDFVDSADAAPPINLWVAYYANQTRGAAVHSPKECLPGAGWEYEKLDRRTLAVANDGGAGPFRVNQAIAVNGAERIALVYWIDARGRRLANEFMNKIYNLYDTITIARSDGALVRVITRVAEDESDAAAFARVERFIETMYPRLQPHLGR